MKTKLELMTGKKSTYSIIDEEGIVRESGFRNKCCASQNIPRFKISKHEKLKVIEVQE